MSSASLAGLFNPDTHDPILIISHIPRRGYQRMSTTALPRSRDDKARAMQELKDSMQAPRFEGTYPDPPPEKPQKPTRLDYPRDGSFY